MTTISPQPVAAPAEDSDVRLFENAVLRFGKETRLLQSNEKTFQAHLAMSLMKDFEAARIQREVHLFKHYNKKHNTDGLFTKLQQPYPDFYACFTPDSMLGNNEFFPDICVMREHNVDTRHSATRSLYKDPAEMLAQMSIVMELKVTGSKLWQTPMLEIERDFRKLALFSEVTQQFPNRPAVYMVVLNNHQDRQRFTEFVEVGEMYSRLVPLWPQGVTKPTLLHLTPNAADCEMQVIRPRV